MTNPPLRLAECTWTEASAEEGERLFQALGTIVADAVEELLRPQPREE